MFTEVIRCAIHIIMCCCCSNYLNQFNCYVIRQRACLISGSSRIHHGQHSLRHPTSGEQATPWQCCSLDWLVLPTVFAVLVTSFVYIWFCCILPPPGQNWYVCLILMMWKSAEMQRGSLDQVCKRQIDLSGYTCRESEREFKAQTTSDNFSRCILWQQLVYCRSRKL